MPLINCHYKQKQLSGPPKTWKTLCFPSIIAVDKRESWYISRELLELTDVAFTAS